MLGPSNARDVVGRAADYFSDPTTYLRYEKFGYSRFAAKTIDVRARNYDVLNDVEKNFRRLLCCHSQPVPPESP